jgi:hypothetical protein
MEKTEQFLVIEQDQGSSDSMNASANCALFLQSSASNTLLPELTNCGSAETDDYTHMLPQEDE